MKVNVGSTDRLIRVVVGCRFNRMRRLWAILACGVISVSYQF